MTYVISDSEFSVTYDKPSRPVMEFIDEVALLLQSMRNQAFAIYNTGSLASRFLIEVANRVQIPFVDLVLNVDGYPRPVSDRAYPVRLSLEALEAIILEKAKHIAFPSVEICTALHVGEKIHLPVIYDTGWAVPIEREATFTIAQVLREQQRVGFPLIYRSAPELVQAQIGTDVNYDAALYVRCPGSIFDKELADFAARVNARFSPRIERSCGVTWR